MKPTASAIRSFTETFKRAGSLERAEQEKRYLKSELKFFGAPLPVIRKSIKDYCALHPDMTRDDLLRLVSALWETEHHELRSVGIGLLERRCDLLKVTDMRFVEELLRRSQTWAYVDWLATKVAGALVLEHPGAKRYLPRWSRDRYMWVRRAAMLTLLPSLKRDGADFPMFSRFASSMIEEPEFFIRKAIGWILREVGKKRPVETSRFLNAHIDKVSGLTLREGCKYLPPADRAALLKRYQTRRG